MKHQIWNAGFLCLFALAAVKPLHAQNGSESKPPVYIYVSEWDVPRPEWADMLKLSDKDKPLMEKLLADGTLTSYGAGANLIHQAGAPTHTEWFAAASEGNLLKTLDAIYKTPGETDAKVLSDSKHSDILLVCHIHKERSGTWENAYLTGVQWTVKPGQMHAYEALANKTIVPVFDKLMADGAVISYGLGAEDFHTSKIGMTTFYFITPDAASFDKASKAIDDAFDQNPALNGALRALVEDEGHRDFIDRVSYVTNK